MAEGNVTVLLFEISSDHAAEYTVVLTALAQVTQLQQQLLCTVQCQIQILDLIELGSFLAMTTGRMYSEIVVFAGL